MTQPSSVLEDTTQKDKLIHILCDKCDKEFSLCGVPRFDRRIMPPGSANCKECRRLQAKGEHV